MIKLDETSYIDLSLDKVTLEKRKEICRQFNYYDNYTKFYMILFKHESIFYNGMYDSYTSNQKLYPDMLHFLRDRVEITNKSIGGM